MDVLKCKQLPTSKAFRISSLPTTEIYFPAWENFYILFEMFALMMWV